MRRARVWGRDIEMQGGPWTFVVYRREFGGDLLTDVADAFKQDPLRLDDLMRFAWAMCATWSDDAGGFEEWCKSFPEFTVAGGEGAAFASVVSSALEAEVFPPRPSRLGRWWRGVRARWLGWLSQRRRARAHRLRAA